MWQANTPPSPMNPYQDTFFVNMVVQSIAEQGCPEDRWHSLNIPALDYNQALTIAPALPEAVAKAVKHYRVPTKLHDRILSEMEGLAQAVALGLPQEQKDAIAAAALNAVGKPAPPSIFQGKLTGFDLSRQTITVHDPHTNIARTFRFPSEEMVNNLRPGQSVTVAAQTQQQHFEPPQLLRATPAES